MYLMSFFSNAFLIALTTLNSRGLNLISFILYSGLAAVCSLIKSFNSGTILDSLTPGLT